MLRHYAHNQNYNQYGNIDGLCHTWRTEDYKVHLNQVIDDLNVKGNSHVVLEPGDATRYELMVFKYYQTKYRITYIGLNYKNWFVYIVEGERVFIYDFPGEMNKHSRQVLVNYLNSISTNQEIMPLTDTWYEEVPDGRVIGIKEQGEHDADMAN